MRIDSIIRQPLRPESGGVGEAAQPFQRDYLRCTSTAITALSGRLFVENHGTYTAALGLQFPIFEGGRIRARSGAGGCVAGAAKAEAADLRGRIDYEVRTAFLDVNAAREQVAVAQSARKLAAGTIDAGARPVRGGSGEQP